MIHVAVSYTHLDVYKRQAYDHAEDGGLIRPRLTGLRHVLAITTLGSPWWVDRLVMRQPVARVLRTGILRPCAPQAGFRMLSLYQAEAMEAGRLARFEARVAQALQAWPCLLYTSRCV